MTIRTSDDLCRSPAALQNERPFGLDDAPARIGTCTLQTQRNPRRPFLPPTRDRERLRRRSEDAFHRRGPFIRIEPRGPDPTRTPEEEHAAYGEPHAGPGTREQAVETAWALPCHRPFHPETTTRASATLELRARPPYTQPATFFEVQDSGASSVRDGSSTSAVTTTYGHSPLEHRSLRGRRPQPSSGTHSDVSGSVSQARFT
jgi:hypothetical protein